MILLLKFLMKEVFAALNDSLVSALNAATAVFAKMGSEPLGTEILNLVPQ